MSSSDEVSRGQAPEEAGTLAAAEGVLSRALGGRVHLERDGREGERHAARVLRCRVVEAPEGAPSTVILKRVHTDEGETLDPADAPIGSSSARFFNEWCGGAFLTRADLRPPLSPRLHGGDRATGVVVLEDLGEGESLADRLTGTDAGKAEEALLAYARSLGRLHAATAGRGAEWGETRVSLGMPPHDPRAGAGRWLEDDPPRVRRACEDLGIRVAPGFDAEAAAAAAAVAEPGPFGAFSPGDTCPDNHRLNGESVRFFDFEWCGFQHTALDAVYLLVPFPTCWCVNRLPPELPRRAEAAYRSELVRGIPEAGDDARYGRDLACAWAFWAWRSVSWHLKQSLEADSTWGIAGLRQRQLLRLDNLAEGLERLGHLPAMAETARAMAAALRARWGSDYEMPLYPAFRAT